MKGLLKLGTLGLVVGAVALAASRIPLQSLPDTVPRLGFLGPVAGAAVGAALVIALVPRTAISLLCGRLFGARAGAAMAVVAAVVAAVATFLLGRWAGRSLVERKLAGRLARADTWLTKRGTLAVIVVRLVPIGPFGLLGYAYGTSSTAFRHYLVGTSVGAVPSAFAYAAIGSAIVSGGQADLLTYAPALAGVMISLGAVLYWRLRPSGD